MEVPTRAQLREWSERHNLGLSEPWIIDIQRSIRQCLFHGKVVLWMPENLPQPAVFELLTSLVGIPEHRSEYQEMSADDIELKQTQQALTKAPTEEDYPQAAILRDQINEIKSRNGNQEEHQEDCLARALSRIEDEAGT